MSLEKMAKDAMDMLDNMTKKEFKAKLLEHGYKNTYAPILGEEALLDAIKFRFPIGLKPTMKMEEKWLEVKYDKWVYGCLVECNIFIHREPLEALVMRKLSNIKPDIGEYKLVEFKKIDKEYHFTFEGL